LVFWGVFWVWVLVLVVRIGKWSLGVGLIPGSIECKRRSIISQRSQGSCSVEQRRNTEVGSPLKLNVEAAKEKGSTTKEGELL